MNMNIRTRNFQTTARIENYLEKRLKKLDRLLDKDAEATVTFIGEKKKQRVEITIPVNGYILRGEEDNEDILTAIDLVSDKLEKQLVRSKERFSKKGNLSITKLPTFTSILPAVDDDTEVELMVRTKTFPSTPMALDDAITQMDMVGHTFFVFVNEENGETNVLYRRNDGHYGLLEPETI